MVTEMRLRAQALSGLCKKTLVRILEHDLVHHLQLLNLNETRRVVQLLLELPPFALL